MRRPDMFSHTDIPDAAVRDLAALRAHLRPQILSAGHTLFPFSPGYHFDGRRTSSITSSTSCASCQLSISMSVDLITGARGLDAWSAAALRPCPKR